MTKFYLRYGELDSRITEGVMGGKVIISLLWDREFHRTVIKIDDTESNRIFPVPCHKALDAFAHPFAYAPE